MSLLHLDTLADSCSYVNHTSPYIIYERCIINFTSHDARTCGASDYATTDVCVCLVCTYIALISKLHDTIKCGEAFRYVHMSS